MQALLAFAFALVSWTLGFIMDRHFELRAKVRPVASLVWLAHVRATCLLQLQSTADAVSLHLRLCPKSCCVCLFSMVSYTPRNDVTAAAYDTQEAGFVMSYLGIISIMAQGLLVAPVSRRLSCRKVASHSCSCVSPRSSSPPGHIQLDA